MSMMTRNNRIIRVIHLTDVFIVVLFFIYRSLAPLAFDADGGAQEQRYKEADSEMKDRKHDFAFCSRLRGCKRRGPEGGGIS